MDQWDRFNWKALRPDDPSYYTQLTFSGGTYEELLRRFSNGEQVLFFSTEVTFTNHISSTDLLASARETWEALRFDVPTIAAQTEFDVDSWNVTMSYRLAKSSKEVKEWAKRTVRLGEGSKDLSVLRYELGKKMIPEENGDQTFLYVLPTSESSYGFLLHTHHTPFDGIAVQIIMNDFLTRLVKSIGSSVTSSDSLPWGTENKNLLPPTSAILGPAEAIEGPIYQKGLGMIIDSFVALQHKIGFKVRNIGPGATRRTHSSFSEEETMKFVEAVRTLGFTVNEIAHAAIWVVCYLHNPTTEATPPNALYTCLGLMNCRDRLLSQYKDYRGYCLGIQGIAIPASVIASAASKGENQQLIEVARAVKVEYEKWKANPSILSGQPDAGHVIIQATKAAGAPAPDVGLRFSGDGVVDNYINRTLKGPDGQVAATIDDLFMSLNDNNPGPFFRIFTWRGRLRLSVDSNEYAVPNDIVQGFVDKWASLLRLLL